MVTERSRNRRFDVSHFDVMQARVSAARERLANDRLERQIRHQKRERMAARRQAAGATILYFLPRSVPAPATPSAWEQERDFG